MSDDNELAVQLKFTYVGVFTVNDGIANMDINDFMKNNSSALMLPFIREHISSITARAGIDMILLPPININAMLKKEEPMRGKTTDDSDE